MRLISKTGERRKISDYVSMILLVVVMAFTGYVLVMNANGKAVSVFGYSILRVVTGSMEPTLTTGEYIIVEKTDTSELAAGDIITFYSEDPEIKDYLVTHRVMEVRDNGSFVTKGDANTVEDEIVVKPERVLGKYVRKARFFGMISSFADAKKLLLFLVIIPILVLSFYEIKSLAKLWKKLGDEEGKKEIAKESEIEKLKREAIEEYLRKNGQDDGKGQEDSKE